MKIIFLNIWKGVRRKELTEFIEVHRGDTDVWCLQEVDPPADELIDELLPGTQVKRAGKFFRKNFLVRHSEYMATYAAQGLTLEQSMALLPSDQRLGCALYTHSMQGDIPVHIVNVHGIPWPGKLDTEKRLTQSSTIIDFCKDKSGVTIIGGDFNLLPEAESVRMFQKAGYRDLIQEYGIITTRNRFAWERFPNNPLYHSDYVFVRGNAKVTKFEVPSLEISDHLPMILELEA